MSIQRLASWHCFRPTARRFVFDSVGNGSFQVELLENVKRSALVSALSDRICIEMCSLTIDDVDSRRLNDRYRVTCGKTMVSENNGTASRSVYEALNPTQLRVKQNEIRAKLAELA